MTTPTEEIIREATAVAKDRFAEIFNAEIDDFQIQHLVNRVVDSLRDAGLLRQEMTEEYVAIDEDGGVWERDADRVVVEEEIAAYTRVAKKELRLMRLWVTEPEEVPDAG